MRKTVQLATYAIPGLPGQIPPESGVYALCDDGTIWLMFEGTNWRWERQPDIPQDDPTEGENAAS